MTQERSTAMPPRTSKRAARAEAEAQEALALQHDGPPTEEEVEVDDADDDRQAGAAASSAFAALTVDDAEEEVTSDLDTATASPAGKRKRKKRKGKKPAGDTVQSTDEPPAALSPAKSAKAREKVADLDEIDAALRDLNAKYAATSNASDEAKQFRVEVPSSAVTSLRQLLAVDMKHLDADAELKRMFGAKVVNAAATQTTVRGARASNPHHRSGRARAGLAKPGTYWPPIAMVRSGLTMEPIESIPSTLGIFHSFEHSKAYRATQSQFLEAVSSHDPNSIMALLSVNPYHIDSLLQLAEIQAHQGDQGAAEDFLDRALYAMERAFAPTFQLATGNARLSFSRVESRAMFRALERKITSLMRRGCWRTAFEFARLLLALSPLDDPYGALLFLDFLAPKNKQTRFLQDLIPALTDATAERGASDTPLQFDSYPGLAYGHALALYEAEASKDHTESTLALERAILRFPSVVLCLYDKLGHSYPPALASCERAQAPVSQAKGAPLGWILAQLYVHRSESMWKVPEVSAWLQKTAKNASTRINDASDPDVARGSELAKPGAPYGVDAFPLGVARHILAADSAPIRALLPPAVYNAQSYSFDLLPPRGDPDATFYNEAYFRVADPASRRRSAPRQANLPSDAELAGIFQELGAPPDLPMDELRQMYALLQGMPRDDLGRADMPGGLDDLDDDDEEEAEEGQGALGNLWRALMGRGGAPG